MKDLKTFQLAIVIIFIVAAVVAVLVFAGFINIGGKSETKITGTVNVWGTIPREAMISFIDPFSIANPDIKIVYTQKSADTFNSEFVEALASNRGPDLVLVNEDFLLKNSDRIFPIPYASVDERTIKDIFVREGELVLSQQGVLGFPVTIDPMVLYYNRDLFDKAGIAISPKTWEEVQKLVDDLTIVDKTTNNIKQSAIALGDFQNITNAKEIVSLFMLQSGASIIEERSGQYICTLREDTSGNNETPLISSMNSYLEYGNPTSEFYTWNRGLQESRNMFILGKLAMYVGFASDLFTIQQQNPNLNYDVAPMPQFATNNNSATFGRMTIASVVKNTPNFDASYFVATQMTSKDYVAKIASALSLPPARRDLLSLGTDTAYAQSFYNAALIARSWLDPEKAQTNTIFKDMINAVSSGRLTTEQAINEACANIDSVLGQIIVVPQNE